MATIGVTDPTNPLASLSAPAAAGARKTDETEDRFLALLVSQLRNQDPLNPLDNAQVTTQLAQINTVKGIERLAAKLDTLIGRADAAQPLAAAGMVGRQVLFQGDAIALADGAAKAGFDLAQAADEVTVRIKDASGLVLHAADLGPHAAGIYQFTWDGLTDSGVPAAAGTYRFELDARTAGKPVGAEALAFGRVDGVTPGADGVTFTIGGLPPVSIGRIKQFL